MTSTFKMQFLSSNRFDSTYKRKTPLRTVSYPNWMWCASLVLAGYQKAFIEKMQRGRHGNKQVGNDYSACKHFATSIRIYNKSNAPHKLCIVSGKFVVRVFVYVCLFVLYIYRDIECKGTVHRLLYISACDYITCAVRMVHREEEESVFGYIVCNIL